MESVASWQAPCTTNSERFGRHQQREIDSPASDFLLAEKDEVVAPRYQHLVVDAYGGEKRLITLRGANHNTPLERAALTDPA